MNKGNKTKLIEFLKNLEALEIHKGSYSSDRNLLAHYVSAKYRFENNHGIICYHYTNYMKIKAIQFVMPEGTEYLSSVDLEHMYVYYDEVVEDLHCTLTNFVGCIKAKDPIEDYDKIMYIDKELLDVLYSSCRLNISPLILNTRLRLSNKVTSVVVPKSLNSTKTSYLTADSSGIIKLKGTDIKVKLSKVIQQLNPDLDSTAIEKVITAWKGIYNVKLDSVLVSSDIGGVYDKSRVGGSCMAYNGEFMDIYEDFDCKIAYIQDEYGALLARCILWDNNLYLDDDVTKTVKCYDRIFFEKEIHKITLTRWCEENGFIAIATVCDGNLKSLGTFDSYPYLPYMDTMNVVIDNTRDGGHSYQLASNSDYGYYRDCLSCTDGSSEDRSGVSEFSGVDYVYCIDIDEDRDCDDCFYCVTNDEYYWSDDSLVYIGGAYHSHELDDGVCQTQDDGGYAWHNKEDCYEDNYGDFWSSEEAYLEYLEEDL